MTTEQAKTFPLQQMIPFSKIYEISEEWVGRHNEAGFDVTREEAMVIVAAQIGTPEGLQGDSFGMMFGKYLPDPYLLPVTIQTDEFLNVFVRGPDEFGFPGVKKVTHEELIADYAVLALNELESVKVEW